MTSEPNVMSSLGGPYPVTDADNSTRPGRFHPTQAGPGGLLVPECWRPLPMPASFPCSHSGDPRLSLPDVLLPEACPGVAPWEPTLPHRMAEHTVPSQSWGLRPGQAGGPAPSGERAGEGSREAQTRAKGLL